jgi:lambda repressor-like predicted transcriptional regulator
VTALAEREGVEGSTLRSALIRRSPAGQLIIANHLGVRPQEIWPSRYPNDGKRMRRPQRPSHNLHTAGSSGQRQNDGAS